MKKQSRAGIHYSPSILRLCVDQLVRIERGHVVRPASMVPTFCRPSAVMPNTRPGGCAFASCRPATRRRLSSAERAELVKGEAAGVPHFRHVDVDKGELAYRV